MREKEKADEKNGQSPEGGNECALEKVEYEIETWKAVETGRRLMN